MGFNFMYWTPIIYQPHIMWLIHFFFGKMWENIEKLAVYISYELFYLDIWTYDIKVNDVVNGDF